MSEPVARDVMFAAGAATTVPLVEAPGFNNYRILGCVGGDLLVGVGAVQTAVGTFMAAKLWPVLGSGFLGPHKVDPAVPEQDWDVRGVTDVRVYGTDSAGHAVAQWEVVNDDVGRLVRLVGPTSAGDTAMDGTHSYDGRGRLSGITEVGLGAFGMGYDVVGRMSTLTRPGGVVTTTTYDEASRTVGIATVDAVDQEGTKVYAHDERGRLVGVDHPDGAEFGDESYSYDQAERRTGSHRDPVSEVVHDEGDRLVQDATYTYGYDDEGRRVSRTDRVTGLVTTYGYSVLDQLVSLEEGGERWDFTYDARELRVLVRQAVGGSEVYGASFVYDLNGTVRASYGTDGRTAAYLAGFGFGEVLARVDSGAEVALRDRLGTTVGWVDSAGVQELVVRDAYGVRGGTGIVVPFGYTGHAEDPTGLVWGRARNYAPNSGSWSSADKLPRQPRYSYGRGAPILYSDPDGRGAFIEYGVLSLQTVFTLGTYIRVVGAVGPCVEDEVSERGGSSSVGEATSEGLSTTYDCAACLLQYVLEDYDEPPW